MFTVVGRKGLSLFPIFFVCQYHHQALSGWGEYGSFVVFFDLKKKKKANYHVLKFTLQNKQML